MLPGEKALMVDGFDTKLYMSLIVTNISHKLEKLGVYELSDYNHQLLVWYTHVELHTLHLGEEDFTC